MLDVPLGGKVVGSQDSLEVIRFYMRCMPLYVYNVHVAYRMLAFKRRAARKRCFPSWFFWSDNNHVQRSTLFSSGIFVLVGELQNSVHPESTLKDVANLSLDAGVFLHWMLRRHRRCYSVDGNLPTINVSFQIRMFNSPAGRQILLAEDEKISHLAPGRIKIRIQDLTVLYRGDQSLVLSVSQFWAGGVAYVSTCFASTWILLHYYTATRWKPLFCKQLAIGHIGLRFLCSRAVANGDYPYTVAVPCRPAGYTPTCNLILPNLWAGVEDCSFGLSSSPLWGHETPLSLANEFAFRPSFRQPLMWLPFFTISLRCWPAMTTSS